MIKTIVNSFLFLSGSLILSRAILWDVNFLNYEAPIEHSNYKSISLKNFKGKKRSNQNLDGMNEFAYIVTEMKFKKKSGKNHYLALFHPSRSYTFDNSFESDEHLLTHEITHFHITEYCCRMLRKEINNSTNINKADFNEIENRYSSIEKAMQLMYDEETYHGYVLNKQLYWQNKMDSLLNSLLNFKNTEINLIK